MLSIKEEFRTQHSAFRGAFTLAEALLAVVVLSIAVGAIMGPISASYTQTRTVKQTTTAISMAHQLLDEILSKPYVDPSDQSLTLGREADEPGRSAFDNIDDYHGYHDTTDPTNTSSLIKTTTGQALNWNSTDIFSRDVTVEYRATADGAAAASGDFVVVKVVVTMPHNHKVSVQRMVCRYTRGN